MSDLQRWSRGEPLSAEKLSRPVDTLNNLLKARIPDGSGKSAEDEVADPELVLEEIARDVEAATADLVDEDSTVIGSVTRNVAITSTLEAPDGTIWLIKWQAPT